jgi:2-oxoisovalerate dehydrogenase E1 component alpha subunit
MDHETDADTPVQLLRPDGTRTTDHRYPLQITDTHLTDLYRDLVLARRVDSEAIMLQRQGELGLWTSLLGQEAAQVGAAHALRPHDMVFPSYREHAVALCRGMDPVALLALWRGSSAGGWDPHQHNFAGYTIVIGAQTLHAVGYALGVVHDRQVDTGDPGHDSAVIVFLGDGAMSQGDVSEAFVWAATRQLPIVFFCQNNQWAISAPVSTQSRIPLYRRAAGFGFPGIRVDGNDVLACLAVTRHALERARTGHGPTLIEALTYRMNPHTTSDDARRYRDQAELGPWKARDPIARVRALLHKTGTPADFFATIDAEADKLAARIRTEGRALPDATIPELFDHVYDHPTVELTRQRHDLLRYSGLDDWHE